jgi:hypothetical protein
MPEERPSAEQVRAHIQSTFHDVARMLRETHHLEPEAQEALADLVDELGKVLTPAALANSETAHLTTSVAELAKALRQQHNANLLSAAKQRLEQAAVRAEAKAPVAAGVVRRILETLADLGI